MAGPWKGAEILMIYVNPDDFLGNPRVFTDERNREAWRACKNIVESTLTGSKERYTYFLVCGVQGSGKTRWTKENEATFTEPALVFDAAHARVSDRAAALAQARRFGCRIVCIWIRCPLDVALMRNRARPADQVVPDEVVQLVFNTFEPPTVEEGFDEVLEIANS
jgi:AAA domain-containing protein